MQSSNCDGTNPCTQYRQCSTKLQPVGNHQHWQYVVNFMSVPASQGEVSSRLLDRNKFARDGVRRNAWLMCSALAPLLLLCRATFAAVPVRRRDVVAVLLVAVRRVSLPLLWPLAPCQAWYSARKVACRRGACAVCEAC